MAASLGSAHRSSVNVSLGRTAPTGTTCKRQRAAESGRTGLARSETSVRRRFEGGQIGTVGGLVGPGSKARVRSYSGSVDAGDTVSSRGPQVSTGLDVSSFTAGRAGDRDSDQRSVRLL